MAFSFRASPEVELALAGLMDLWKCNKSAAISKAVLEAAQEPDEILAEAVKDGPLHFGPDQSKLDAFSRGMQKKG